MTATKIEWTDATWNPITGCTRVSPGCDNCYMYALYPRLKAMGVPGYESCPEDVRLLYERVELPLRWTKPRRVFVNSMSDTFHPRVPFDFITRLFQVMQESIARHGHTFQLLTKRPGRAVAWWEANQNQFPGAWPANVWMGTSVESQQYAPRVTVLARIPAKYRWVSAEPLLGPLDLSPWLNRGDLQWVVAGGESGPRARPMDLSWARTLRDQSSAAGVPFFFKQLGGRRGKRGGDEALLDERLWREWPATQDPVPSGRKATRT